MLQKRTKVLRSKKNLGIFFVSQDAVFEDPKKVNPLYETCKQILVGHFKKLQKMETKELITFL